MAKKLTTEEFVRRAKNKHGLKYDYSNVKYVNNKTSVIITCPVHGKFAQGAEDHFYGSECPLCAKRIRAEKRTLSIEQFVQKAQKIHQRKYDYSNIRYFKTTIKILIVCPTHGEFKQKPKDHLQGSGCPSCAGVARLTISKFINKAQKKHGHKYNYSKVLCKGYHTKVTLICPQHGKFKQTPGNHLLGHGCAKCSKFGTSVPEHKWLDQQNIRTLEKQKTIQINNTRYRVDGYDSSTNTIYEFFGDFWHGNPKIYNPNDINPVNKKSFGELYKATMHKLKIYEENDYNIIYIWEADFIHVSSRTT